jgi:hypothetical protein
MSLPESLRQLAARFRNHVDRWRDFRHVLLWADVVPSMLDLEVLDDIIRFIPFPLPFAQLQLSMTLNAEGIPVPLTSEGTEINNILGHEAISYSGCYAGKCHVTFSDWVVSRYSISLDARHCHVFHGPDRAAFPVFVELARDATKLLVDAGRLSAQPKPDSPMLSVAENHWSDRLMDFVHSLALEKPHGYLLYTDRTDHLKGHKLPSGITASELRVFEAVAMALEIVAADCEAPPKGASSKSKSKPKCAGGRPKDTDVEEDRRIAEAWNSGSHASLEDLASAKGKSKYEVQRALDRHRKRAGKTPLGKFRQGP